MLLPAVWAFADLLLRRDLPGAALLQHAAFRALVVPLVWLTEDDGHRLRVALALWGFALASVLYGGLRTRPTRALLAATAGVVVAFEAVTVALAALMERSLALGMAAGIGVWLWRRADRAADERPSWPLVGFAAAAAAASLYYVYALFMTFGQGYPLLHALGDALRGGGSSFFGLWAVSVVALGGLAAALLAKSRGRAALIEVAPGALLAALVGAAGAPAAAVIAGPTAVLVVAALLPGLVGLRGPLRWPVLAALPCVLAGLLFGHTYSARVLSCPDADDPRVRVLASPGEVFRIAQGERGVLALSLRADRRFGRLDLRSGGPLGFSDAGPLAPTWGRAGGADLAGTPEELVYAASRGQFFGSVVPHDQGRWADGPVLPKNLIATLDGDAAGVVAATGVEGLCWINTLHWSEPEGLLYVGCEEVAGLHRWDPDGGLHDSNLASQLGDVQDLAFGEGADEGRLWTVSLWNSRRLTELDREDLSVLRQVPIGGMSYHVTYDPDIRRLFASGYYAGRVRVVETEGLTHLRSLPSGFGTREVTVARKRKLLLASGTYDGLLRVWDTASPPPLAIDEVQVGGHVKDITVDEAGDRAWLWSQCGLLELDLNALGRRP